MKDAIVYKLKTPVELGSETITEIRVGKIKGKHMRSLPADPKSYTMGTMMDLASKVVGESSAVLDEMDSEDLMEVIGLVGEALGAGPTTGASA